MKTKITLLFLMAYSVAATASSTAVQNIYNPYVQQLEKELEYKLLITDDSRSQFADQTIHQLTYGRSLSDHWLGELSIIASDDQQSSLKVTAYELELKWQLSEQGEYNNDWGLLFEVEYDKQRDDWELATGLIVLHEWGQWIGTANIKLAYETNESEIESEFAGQLRYRHNEKFEPAIEYFKSENTNAIGPAASGLIRLTGNNKLRWEAGLALSLDDSKADTIWRFFIEYEFF